MQKYDPDCTINNGLYFCIILDTFVKVWMMAGVGVGWYTLDNFPIFHSVWT